MIVFNHVLVSGFLFYRNPRRFLVDVGCKSNTANSASDAGSAKSKQLKQETDIWVRTDFRGLHQRVTDSIQYIASKSVTAMVYLLDEDSQELYGDIEHRRKLPTNGICWEAWSMQKARACQNLDPGDPVSSELADIRGNIAWKPRSVVCFPAVDDRTSKVIAILVVGSNFGEEIDAHSLMPLAEQIVACYRNMCDGSTREQYRETASPPATSDKEAIVKLCGELYEQDASDLQLKIVKYLEEQTSAECAFLLFVVPETQELYCQVVGDKVLNPEVRFPGTGSTFSGVLDTKDILRMENVAEDTKKELEDLLRSSVNFKSLVCVPVTSRNCNGLVAIACVANKIGADSFTSEDVQTIQTCFKYTAAVLSSTLAFENEQKLRKQTQAMLEVTKNLFTHLGKSMSSLGTGSDNYPDILCNRGGVNVHGPSFKDQLVKEEEHRGSARITDNSARIDIRNVTEEIHRQGMLAQKLTGYNDFDRFTQLYPEKVKGYQVHPKIKSPEHKQMKKASPQKENISPYKHPDGRRYDMSNFDSDIDENLLFPSISDPFVAHLLKNAPVVSCSDKDASQKTMTDKEVCDEYPSPDDCLADVDFKFYVRECWTDSSSTGPPKLHQRPTDLDDHFGTVPVDKISVDLSRSSSGVYTSAEREADRDSEMSSSMSSVQIIGEVEKETYDTAVEMLGDGGNDSCGDVCTGGSDLVTGGVEQHTNCVGNRPNQCSEITSLSTAEEEVTTSGNSFEIFSVTTSLPKPDGQIHSPISASPRSSNPASLYEPSGVSSEMYTCLEFEASDSNPDDLSCADIEEIPLDLPQLSYHDAWAGSSTRVRACRSVPLGSQIEGYELDFNDILNIQMSTPRFSISDPAIRKYDPKSQFEDSKANMNNAFCRGSSAVLSTDSNAKPSINSTPRLVKSFEQLGIELPQPDTSAHASVIEDTETDITHIYLLATDSSQSTVSDSLPGVSPSDLSWSCLGPTPSVRTEQDMRNTSKLQFPSTEAVSFPISKSQESTFSCYMKKENDLTKLLREIMQEARNLTHAERCSVFLIDEETEELVAKVFDGITTNDNQVQSEIRMPITQGIAGHVATTGKLLNIKDAYSHPMFYRGIDDSTGFRTRNILCFPIKNEAGNVLGVAQLCNKKTGPYFTTFDEDVASAFAVYCCISISHSLMYQRVIAAQIRNSLANELMMYHMKCLMYKKLQDSQHRNRLANELMNYHMQVAQEEVDELAHNDIHPPSFWNAEFDQFSFPPRKILEDDTSMACLTMFEDLGFISKFRIKRDTLARFVLMVRRGYRNPPYHNWMHAFAVTHFCYVCIKNLKLTQNLAEIELFALFVSCLCHDIDHRGTNNSYQSVSKSVLAALYSSEGSYLERHHFAQSMCIVNTDGCNIYENLSSKHYQQALDLMRDIILATDLAHHLRILKNIESMAVSGYEVGNPKHHKLLLCLLMTASDLSDQTKPWDATKHIAALIYKEFFSQGDMEKSMGKEPLPMMDRERARIPDLQIGFLDDIALPVYKVLSELFPKAGCVKTAVADNRRHWEKICALIKLRRGGSCEQMSYDQILALEAEDSSPMVNQANHIQ